MFRETVSVNRLTARRSEHQIDRFEARANFTRNRLLLTEESNNPSLQSNRATASSTFGVREAPSPVQSPNASDNADRLSSPVDVLPLKTQVLTRAHAGCEGNCEHRAIGCGQCDLEQCPCLLNRPEPAFRFVAAAVLSRHQQGSQATNATGGPAAWQIVKQRACSG